MPDVFDSIKMNKMSCANRFVRSATYEGLAEDDGTVTRPLVSLYAELAQGRIGLIVAGYAYVQPDGKGGPGMMGICSDAHVEGLSRLTRAVHEHGAKIACQIVHCGRQTVPALVGGDLVAPSAVPTKRLGIVPRELSIGEIETIIENFGKAALRAREAGFDAVQIHCAHGYLLNQFLAANANKRMDKYGGGLADRATALFEVYSEIRTLLGKNFPILIKLNCADFVDGGLTLEESLWVGARLADMGIDGIEVSGGVWDTENEEGKAIQRGVPRKRPEAYFLPYAEQFKHAASAPVIAVGGIRSIETAQAIVREGRADLVSLCRPFIREPHLVKRWLEGDRSPAQCVSCNRCLALTPAKGLQCFRKNARKRDSVE